MIILLTCHHVLHITLFMVKFYNLSFDYDVIILHYLFI
jgi:hypothetical protein